MMEILSLLQDVQGSAHHSYVRFTQKLWIRRKPLEHQTLAESGRVILKFRPGLTSSISSLHVVCHLYKIATAAAECR